ncbi:hypothetical protein DPMN_140041, partial [Dreissena polymorpha]
GRLDGIVYEVGIATGSWEECGRFLGPGHGVVNITTTCDRTMHGRYVRIRKIKQDYLSLCEVLKTTRERERERERMRERERERDGWMDGWMDG